MRNNRDSTFALSLIPTGIGTDVRNLGRNIPRLPSPRTLNAVADTSGHTSRVWEQPEIPHATPQLSESQATIDQLKKEKAELRQFYEVTIKGLQFQINKLETENRNLYGGIFSLWRGHLAHDSMILQSKMDILGGQGCSYPRCGFRCREHVDLESHSRNRAHFYFAAIPLPEGSPREVTENDNISFMRPTSPILANRVPLHASNQTTTKSLTSNIAGTPLSSSELGLLEKIQRLETIIERHGGRVEAHMIEDGGDHTLSSAPRTQRSQDPTPNTLLNEYRTNMEDNISVEHSSPTTPSIARTPNPRTTAEAGSSTHKDTPEIESDIRGSNKRRRTGKEAARFKCDKCSKQFTRSSTLREHARTHTNHRPFMCRVCGKTFVRLKDRNRHDALHSGEKNFACRGGRPMFFEAWGCGRKFAREDALVAHFRNEAGWACLRPLLTDAELRDCLLQFVDGQDEGKGFGCKKAVNFIGRRFGIDRDLSTSRCKESFLSKDDLEFHFQTMTGRKCIGQLLVELGILDARRHRHRREEQDTAHAESLMEKAQVESENETTAITQGIAAHRTTMATPTSPQETRMNESVSSEVAIITSDTIRFIERPNFALWGSRLGLLKVQSV